MNMKTKFKHANIVAADWRRLAQFYEEVFGCTPVPPERHLGGEWLSKGTGVANAQFSGAHLRLPGYGEEGPTLEIYQYSNVYCPNPESNIIDNLAKSLKTCHCERSEAIPTMVTS